MLSKALGPLTKKGHRCCSQLYAWFSGLVGTLFVCKPRGPWCGSSRNQFHLASDFHFDGCAIEMLHCLGEVPPIDPPGWRTRRHVSVVAGFNRAP